jgi:D-tyrosyl-tRNA(Tyr) deacylase
MIALLQRVSAAQLHIGGELKASIGRGLMVLIGVRPTDHESNAAKLATRLLNYRVFGDEAGKMNLNLRQINGDLLIVPQFTLAADTKGGLRPSFSGAAPPELALRLFESLVAAARAEHPAVATGVFGADMQVSLINDGPVTFWLEN